jgi:hypothetical protein
VVWGPEHHAELARLLVIERVAAIDVAKAVVAHTRAGAGSGVVVWRIDGRSVVGRRSALSWGTWHRPRSSTSANADATER